MFFFPSFRYVPFHFYKKLTVSNLHLNLPTLGATLTAHLLLISYICSVNTCYVLMSCLETYSWFWGISEHIDESKMLIEKSNFYRGTLIVADCWAYLAVVRGIFTLIHRRPSSWSPYIQMQPVISVINRFRIPTWICWGGFLSLYVMFMSNVGSLE